MLGFGDLKALATISTIVFGVQGTPNCSTIRDEEKTPKGTTR